MILLGIFHILNHCWQPLFQRSAFYSWLWSFPKGYFRTLGKLLLSSASKGGPSHYLMVKNRSLLIIYRWIDEWLSFIFFKEKPLKPGTSPFGWHDLFAASFASQSRARRLSCGRTKKSPVWMVNWLNHGFLSLLTCPWNQGTEPRVVP